MLYVEVNKEITLTGSCCYATTQEAYRSRTEKYLRAELTHCPHCGTKLQRSHTAWKEVIYLSGVVEIWIWPTIVPIVSVNTLIPSTNLPRLKQYV